MAETNPLLSDPFFSEPILSPKNRPDLATSIAESQAELPPIPSGKEFMQDMWRSGVAGGAKGLAGTVMGAPGSIETFALKDVPEMARSGAAYLGERAGMISPEQQKEISERPIYSGMTPEQEKGLAAPLSGYPTYKAVTEQFKPTMKAAGAEALAYEPQTAPGKAVSAMAEYGAQGIPGAIKGMAGRVMTGAGAGAGSEIAALSSSDPDSEGYKKLMGALGGAAAGAGISGVAGRLYNAAKAWTLPTGVARNELVDMVAEDIRRGLSPMTPDQLKEAAARGAPVTFLDMASPATLRKLGVSADKAPEAEAAAARYKDFLNERAQSSANRISSTLEDVAQAPINAPALQQAMEEAGAKVRDAIYTIMKASPTAQQIPMQVIGADLIKRPIIQQAMREAAETAKNNPDWNIVVPGRIPGKPAVESQWVQTPQGLREVPGAPAVPEQVTHGNLAYWDQVKRELDSKIKAAASPTQPNQSVLATAQANKTDLVNKLNKVVKEYPAARGIASETFGDATAPQAGYEYFKNMNAFKRFEADNALKKMTPEQKTLFEVGFLNGIGEIANAPGGVGALAKKFSTDKNFKERAVGVLGQNKFDEIQGTILSENVLSKAKELRFIEQASGVPGATMAGAAAGAAADATLVGFSPGTAAAVVLGAAAGASRKTFMNAMERKIAAKIVPMATDPAQAAELGRLASQSPVVGQVLNKIIGIMNNKIVTGTSATVTSQERPQRAAGGRAGGMTADMLINAAERAKKSIGKDTEALLSTPDASVAKALAIANQKLEG